MSAELREGGEFAGFTVVGEIGRGGMGVVYLAEQSNLGRRVALKVVSPALAGDGQFRERFDREAHHAASIEHPNVIPIFQAGVEDELVYLAMRYVDGEDLRAVIVREGGLDPEAAVSVVEQVGAALDAAHAKGLVHRDVKPANVMLEGADPSGHAYLTDFGLTKEQAAVSGLTNTGAWVGTVDYAPPEQIDGRAVDARSDVYALACVLYEAIAAKPPFEGTPTQKMWAHMSEAPPSVALMRPRAAALDPVLERGLAKEPDERYQSAGDLARAARAAIAGTEVAVPERSVATGVAAGAAPPTIASASSERATVPLGDDGSPPTERREAPPGEPGKGRRWVLAGVAIAAALAAGIGAAALVAGARDGSEPTPAEPVAPAAETSAEESSGGGSGERREPAGENAEPATEPAEPEPAEPEPVADDWPGGSGYTAILASVETEAQAEAIRADAEAGGLDAGVLFSSDYSSLNPGYWVTFSGAFDAKGDAVRAARAARDAGFDDAYERAIRP